jgi:predicted secreted protein
MKKTISIVLVLALGMATGIANADFIFGTPTNLGPVVNSPEHDYGPSISADGLALYFHSERPGGHGDADLWVATRPTKEYQWGEPVNLGSTVNSLYRDNGACISANGLELYFSSTRPGGHGEFDIYVSTRATPDDDWKPPVNLGAVVNTGAIDRFPSITGNGLELYFSSRRPGGYGNDDVWVTTRTTRYDPWGEPVHLGTTINTYADDRFPSISSDGLVLFFYSFQRSGGSGNADLCMTMRGTIQDDWNTPVTLGPIVNTPYSDSGPGISADGRTLFFSSDRPGGLGPWDLWQAAIIPIVDLNGDGIVDCADMCEMVDHWGTDEQLYDIGPMPWGDGIVDVQDLIVLAEHLFEGIPPVEIEEVNVDENDADSQVELEQGQILVVTLESNPTTGYRWEVVENQESILQQMGEAEFKQSDTGGPPLVGAGGWEIFRFKAISTGQTSLKLVYHRPWEEGVEPINTFSIEVVVN